MKIIIAFVVSCMCLFGQQTYSLLGSGYSSGMHLIERSEFNIDCKDENGKESINFVLITDMKIIDVNDKGIPQKLDITTTTNDSEDESNGKKLTYEFRNGKYVLICVNGETPSESIMATSGNIPAIDDRIISLPTYPIPIGYEMDLPMYIILNFVSTMGINLPGELAHTLGGGLRFKLIGVYEDSYKISLKGKLTSSGSKDLPPGKAIINMISIRDLNTGLLRRSDAEFSCDFKGMKAKGKGCSTQDIIP